MTLACEDANSKLLLMLMNDEGHVGDSLLEILKLKCGQVIEAEVWSSSLS